MLFYAPYAGWSPTLDRADLLALSNLNFNALLILQVPSTRPEPRAALQGYPRH